MSANSRSAGGVFPTPLLGRVVACACLEDSVAVLAANSILSGEDRGPFKNGELDRLAEVLDRYGFSSSAKKLRDVVKG